MAGKISIRPIRAEDRDWTKNVLSEHFGSAKIVSRGKLHDAEMLPALVALKDDQPVGFLHYQIEDGQCEIVAIISLLTKHGVGRALLASTQHIASAENCQRVWLITTNDNIAAQDFYRHMGGEQVAIYRDSIKEARKLKPDIPEFGENGIPIKDEIEFEWRLKPCL